MVRRLRSLQQGDRNEPDVELLQPYSTFKHLLEDELGDLTQDTLDQFLATSLAGIKDWQDLEAIRNVLKDVKRVWGSRSKWSDSQRNPDKDDQPQSTSSSAQAELAKIKAGPFDSPEKLILDAVVDTSKRST
ncbi:hypothetical protein PG984_002820 [Apiospora sp. TS-2023a]